MGEKNFNSDSLEFENFKISIEKDREGGDQELAVLFSSKLVELLIAKMKEHNSFAPQRKVSLNDLKRVYIRGAGECEPDKKTQKTCGQWALARVNMFLRQKLGGKMTINAALTKIDGFVDISESWTPTEEDHAKTDEEIEKYELNYDFKNVEDLYIEPYKKLIVEW